MNNRYDPPGKRLMLNLTLLISTRDSIEKNHFGICVLHMYLRFDVKLIAGAISPGKFLSEFPDWEIGHCGSS
jgi:hypothetical protein